MDQIPPTLLSYLYELEKVNEQLLKSMKMCLQVFTEIGALVPDKEGWLGMLNDIQKVIEVGDRLISDN